MKNDINCIILCAGKGTRMNCETKNKVCFEILGKPAVVRVVENLKKCGVEKFIAVVGSKAESVMNVLSDIDGVTFAYQKEQKGTGNAAMCALNVLNSMGIDGPILTVMGDKLIDSSVFQNLIDDFYKNDSDVSLITQPLEYNPTGGRIAVHNGKIYGIVEHVDLLLLMVREGIKSGRSALEMYEELNLTDKQKAKIESRLSQIKNPCDDCYLDIGGHKFSSEEILSSGLVNCATYLHKRDAINGSIFSLGSDNAQNEIYFTDTIEKIAQSGRVSCVKISERSDIHTFNTIEELEAINKFFSEENR